MLKVAEIKPMPPGRRPRAILAIGQLSMILLDEREFAGEVAGFHQHAHRVVLAADEPVAGHVGAVLLGGEHRHVPPAGANFDQLVAGPQTKLMADHVEVVVLRLVEAACVFLPVPLAVAEGVAEH